MIEVRNINKSFGSYVALDDVSLAVPPGELIALLGPSGCGKTTLLRIVAGLETPDSGKVVLSGRDVSDTHVRKRQVGFVFQHYALFRHMTVFENVAFGLRVKPRAQRPAEAEIRRKVNELLELIQLSWVADRFPAQLSGGQRQRIALARALAVEPQVLLMDEPFGALDAQVRKELRRWMRRLHEELHITSVFVTHDQDEAFEVADRVVLMNRGKIEQVGTVREVYERPATAFAYSFLGATNQFRRRVGGQDVIALARPHELDIEPVQAQNRREGQAATVSRVLAFGALARVELRSLDSQQYIEVELSPERLQELSLRSGQVVNVVSLQSRVFEPAVAEQA